MRFWQKRRVLFFLLRGKKTIFVYYPTNSFQTFYVHYYRSTIFTPLPPEMEKGFSERDIETKYRYTYNIYIILTTFYRKIGFKLYFKSFAN